jgi:uncharacterized membrane protein YqjE
MFERLTVAATLAVRHAVAYIDLILSDAEEAQQYAGRRMWMNTVMATAMTFAVAMICLLVIALTWDTAARIWTVAGLLCFFALSTLFSYLQVRVLRTRRRALFARTAHEWQKDRLLLEKLLNGAATQPHAGDGL